MDVVNAWLVSMLLFPAATPPGDPGARQPPDLLETTRHDPGMWIRRSKIRLLPMAGTAWEDLLDEANEPIGTPLVCDQNDDAEQAIWARTLVWTRLSALASPPPETPAYRDEAIAGILAAVGTDDDCDSSRTLAVGRNMLGYVLSAELLDLDPADDAVFRAWLETVRQTVYDDNRMLADTHGQRPNNWGTHAGASRMAIAIYLGDDDELAAAVDVFHGWIGATGVYDDFNYGDDVSWHPDETTRRGINPAGAVKDGRDIDGVLPDDQRRICDQAEHEGLPECAADESFALWLRGELPPTTNYCWEAMQGAVAQMVLVYENVDRGVLAWEDSALRRAYDWLHDVAAFPAEGDDRFQPWIANYYLGTDYPAESPAGHGKNVGFADWTHAAP